MTQSWLLPNQYVSSQGTVRYDIQGAGPDVVLVHGTPWSSFTWHRLLPTLTKRYRVHFYDLIGYGTSSKHSEQNVSLAVQGKLLAELLAHWELPNPIVVAHDFGGAISLRANLLHGCQYQALQLINVVALAPWGSPFFAHVQQHESAFSGLPDYIHEAIVTAYIKTALKIELGSNEFQMLLSPWLSTEGKSAFYRQIAQADQRYTDEIEHLYPSIQIPVSILWGEHDEWIPIDVGRRLHKAIPGSTFTAVPNSGHLAQLENAEFVSDCINRFLAAH